MSKPTFQGSNINLVKEHNQRAVLLSLLYDGPLSRIQPRSLGQRRSSIRSSGTWDLSTTNWQWISAVADELRAVYG